MKKSKILMAAGICALAIVTGCGEKSTDAEKTAGSYVTLGEYKGIEITAIPDVTDTEVEDELISRFRDTVAEGDTVNIDYSGKKDDVVFEGGTAQGQYLTIGSGSFIDGFEDGLIGVKVGDTVDLDLTFPDPYENNPDLAGAAVVFTVTVNAIDGVVGAEMTDEVITANTDYATVDEYRAAVKEELQTAIDNEKKSALWESVSQNSVINAYPEDEVEAYIAELTEYYELMASYYGVDLATLLSLYGLSEEQFKTECEEAARQQIASYLVLEAIAETEGMTVTEEEIEAEIAEGMELYGNGMTREEFLEYYGGEETAKENVKDNLIYEKVLDFLLTECKEV